MCETSRWKVGSETRSATIDAQHQTHSEQEHFRTTSSSDIDDRTMHEIYTHPFLKSVMAGVGSMMCSYSQLFVAASHVQHIHVHYTDLINSTYACENDKVMNDIVKREYGFQGFIMSDWSA